MLSAVLCEVHLLTGRGCHVAPWQGRHLQQGLRQSEGVSVPACEGVAIDLRWVPVVSSNGQVGTGVQDGLSSVEDKVYSGLDGRH